MHYRAKLLCSVFVLAGTVATSVAAVAQTETASGLEEVVVTARKVTENIQRVPLAVTAISGSELKQYGIQNVGDISKVVPSLQVTSDNSSSDTGILFTIRGQTAADVILSGNNPVAMYEDYVNIPNASGTDLATFDLERIEVLKGPQGTLYGRNTTGGAVNIYTKGADFNGYHGYAYFEAGNYGDLKGSFAVNVPIVDNVLAFRLAYQHWTREGYGRSLISGERFGGDKDDDAVRLSMEFDPTSKISVEGKFEYFRANRTDAMYQTRWIPNTCSASGAFPGNGASCGLGSGGSWDQVQNEWLSEGAVGQSPLTDIAQTNASHNLFVNWTRDYTNDHLTGYHGALIVNWDVTDNITLRWISGVHQITDYRSFAMLGLPIYGYTSGISDVPAPGGVGVPYGTYGPFAVTSPLTPDEEDRQFTQEVDILGSDPNLHIKYQAGIFWSDAEGNERQRASSWPANAAFSVLDTYAPSVGNRTWGVFTQEDFQLNDQFSVTAGVRYSEERLGQFVSSALAFGGPVPSYFCLSGTTTHYTVQPTFLGVSNGCGTQEGLKSGGISYLFSLNEQLTENTLIYLKTARGFRGGALQTRAPALPPAKPEISTDYELGLKTTLFDNTFRGNFAIYDTEYKNKQETAIFIGQNGAQQTGLVNAATARIQGVEAEMTWLPVDALELNASGSYTNSRFLSYVGALTNWGTALAGSVSNVPITNASREILSPWQFNLNAKYDFHDVGPGDLAVTVNYSWRGKIPTTVLNNDPQVPRWLQNEWRQAIGLVDLRLDYGLPDNDSWSSGMTISFFVNNALDKHWQLQDLTFGNNPSFPNGAAFYSGVTQAPRMFGFSIRKSFGDE